MPIHVVIATNPSAVTAALHSNYEGDFYKITADSWILSAPETSKDVSAKLGIAGGENGNGFVAPISSYFGRMPTDLWEWIKINWEKR